MLGIAAYNIVRILGDFRIKNGSFVEILSIIVFFLWWMTAYKTGLPTIVTECTDMLISMLVVLVFAISNNGIVSGFLSNEKMLKLGQISLEFYLVHYMVINYGMIAAKHLGINEGIAVLPLTVLYLVASLLGACLIYYFAEWLLSALRKKR